MSHSDRARQPLGSVSIAFARALQKEWSILANIRSLQAEAGSQPTNRSRPSRIPLNVTLVGWMVAGVQAQYLDLRQALPGEAIRTRAIDIVPYASGGWIERLPLPSSIRGTLRSSRTAISIFGHRRPDAVWSQVAIPLLPFAVTRAAWARIPILFAIDCTPRLLWQFSQHYPNLTDPDSEKGRLTAACLRLFFRRCALLLPWSEWAGRSMVEDYGMPAERVRVVRPGVDLQRWRPADPRPVGNRVQILFVGADFARKGGPLLLDVYRRHFQGDCDLHLVTRAELSPEPSVTLHRDFRPGDPALAELYRRCDLLVLPTGADCYSIAAIEAMACGLPVVISQVGGISEIVRDGETGYLIPTGDGSALVRAMQSLISDPARRRRFGAAGRVAAEQRFDAAAQSARVTDLLFEVTARPS